MATKQAYFNDLQRLLASMPPGQIDMRSIEANEQRHSHRFYDPPETVHQWLLDQQRRALAASDGGVHEQQAPLVAHHQSDSTTEA